MLLRTWLLLDDGAGAKVLVDGPARLWTTCGFTPVPGTFFFAGSRTGVVYSAFVAARREQAERLRAMAAAGRVKDTALLAALFTTAQDLVATAAYAASRRESRGDTNAPARPVRDRQLPPTAPPPEGERRLFAASLAWPWETILPAGRPEQRDILHFLHQPFLSEDAEGTADTTLGSGYRGASFGARRLRKANTPADVFVLARESAEQGRIDETFSWLAQLEEGAATPPCLNSLRATALLTVTGGVDQASALLRQTIAAYPRDAWSWHLLVVAYLQRGALAEAATNVIPAMIAAVGGEDNDFVRLSLALLDSARGGAALRAARDRFVTVAAAHPDLAVACEWALRCDMILDDRPAAQRDANALLSMDANHAQANYVLALLATRTLRLAEADLLYSKSLAGAITPHAMSGRARLCYQRRLYADALQLARKTTTEYPNFAEAWGILADTLDRIGKASEAEVVRAHYLELRGAAAPAP